MLFMTTAGIAHTSSGGEQSSRGHGRISRGDQEFWVVRAHNCPELLLKTPIKYQICAPHEQKIFPTQMFHVWKMKYVW